MRVGEAVHLSLCLFEGEPSPGPGVQVSPVPAASKARRGAGRGTGPPPSLPSEQLLRYNWAEINHIHLTCTV